MKAVGNYIFAGGFTLGVSRHFDVQCHLEDGTFGVETFQKNFPNVPVYVKPAKWPLDELAEQKIDFIYANPPCAAWSALGRTVYFGSSSWKSDERVECTRRAFRVMERVRPTVWVWESVPRAFTMGRELVDSLAERAQEHGYHVTYLFLDSQRLGLPQRRRRFHFVAHKVPLNWQLMPDKIVSVNEALRAVTDPGLIIPEKQERITRLMKDTPPGGAMRKTWEDQNPENTWEIHEMPNGRTRVKHRPPFSWLRMNGEKPAATIAGIRAYVHPTEDRWLTARELSVLCGYPIEYQWMHPQEGETIKEIAQAVTPTVGEYLARCVRDSLEAPTFDVLPAALTTQIVDFRKPGEPVIERL